MDKNNSQNNSVIICAPLAVCSWSRVAGVDVKEPMAPFSSLRPGQTKPANRTETSPLTEIEPSPLTEIEPSPLTRTAIYPPTNECICTLTDQHAWPDVTTPLLQNAWSMALSAMTVELEQFIYFINECIQPSFIIPSFITRQCPMLDSDTVKPGLMEKKDALQLANPHSM